MLDKYCQTTDSRLIGTRLTIGETRSEGSRNFTLSIIVDSVFQYFYFTYVHCTNLLILRF